MPTWMLSCTGAAKAGASNRDGSNGAAALLPALGAQKIGNTFVHLRKIAQHPLLVRSLYTDSTLQEVAAIAHKRWVAHYAAVTAH
jgi:SWI/SNF-related matrix-associated actin-dependent regulator of chromatin subfamily A containing DEAD/H box 1